MAQRELSIILDLKDKASAQLKEFEKNVSSVEKQIGNLKPVFQAAAAAGTAAFAALTGAVVASVKSFADAGDKLKDMSDRTGVAVDALSKLGYAAQMSGSNIEDLEVGMRNMSRFVVSAKDEANSAAKAYAQNLSSATKQASEKTAELNKQLQRAEAALMAADNAAGNSAKNLKPYRDRISDIKEELAKMGDAAKVAYPEASQFGETLGKLGLKLSALDKLNPQEAFYVLADAVSKVKDPMLKSSLAMEVFGKQGVQLLPLLSEGSAKIKELGQEAERLGIVFSEEAAQQAAAFNDEIDRIKAAFQGLTYTIGKIFLPVASEMLEKIQPIIVQVKDWIQTHPELTKNLVLVGIALSALLAGLGLLGLIVPQIIAGVMLLGTVFGAITIPIALVTAAIIAMVAVGAWWAVNWQENIETVKWAWQGFKDFFIGIWESIKHYFTDVWAGIKIIFNEAIDGMIKRIQPLIDLINRVVSGAKSIGSTVVNGVKSVGKTIGVNDAIISPQGDVITTHPDDYLIATKDPHSLAGNGGGVTVNVYGDVSGQDLIEKVKRALAMDIKYQVRI
jgi:TP901 family phage tail tape measure protein